MHLSKYLYPISAVLLILSGILLSGTVMVSAEEDADTEKMEELCFAFKLNGAGMMEEIFEQGGINVDLDFSKVFGGTQKKPKVENLYISLYKLMNTAPSDTALTAAAEQNQMTETEICSILGGNYQLLSTIYNETFSTEDLLDQVESLKDDYNTALDVASFEQELFLETFPQEVFVNGDTEDSGFDVLYDLEIIEYILFGEDSTIGSGGSYGMGDWGDDDEDIEVDPEDEEEDEPEVDPEDEEEEPEEDEDDPEAESEEEEEESMDPSECIADSDVQAAFGAVVPEDSDDDSESDDEDDDDDGSGGGSGDGSGSGGTYGDDATTVASDQTENWTTPKICSSVFCLVIRFVDRGDPEYDTASNCVKCHVDYIAKGLDETTSVSLNPGKLSGNLFEPAMCKKSALNNGRISLNFIPIAMPIRTPPPDDIVSGVNLKDSFKDFIEDTWPLDDAKNFAIEEDEESSDEGGVEVEEEENEYKIMTFFEQLYEKGAKQQATISGSTVSNESIFNNAMSGYEDALAEIDETFDQIVNYSRASGSQSFYQSMKYELDQMVFFFSSYRTLIGLTQEVANDLKNNLPTVS